jgi:hypothetical protein
VLAGRLHVHYECITTIPSPRASIEARVAKEKGFSLIFLESICDDPAVLAANVALKVSSGDPDYKDTSPEVAEKDFLRRIEEYEKIYETITEPHLSYLRIVNVGSSVTVNRINGYLQSRIAFYLMNLHVKPRSIYLSRVRFTSIFMMHPIDCCFSTVKASITWMGVLVEIPYFLHVGYSTQRLFRRWLEITLVMHHLQWVLRYLV